MGQVINTLGSRHVFADGAKVALGNRQEAPLEGGLDVRRQRAA